MSRFGSTLKFIVFVPAVLMTLMSIYGSSCDSSPFASSAGGSAAPTSTRTASGPSMAYVTNFNSGKISEFSRDTSNGKLKRAGEISAGVKQGPKGMAITPKGNFLYVANALSGKIYEYSIGANGLLTSIGFVSDGTGTSPQQIAINPAGNILWVTNFGNGTLSAWNIGSNGGLTHLQTVVGLSGPFGLAVNSASSFLYVADNTAGLIYTFTINSSTGKLTAFKSPVPNLGNVNGSPGLIVIDGSFLYVDDITNGVVSLFDVSAGSLSFSSSYPAIFTANAPIGIAISVVSSTSYLITANQGGGNTWAFQIQNSGALVPPISSGNVNSPTGLAVDSSNSFAYTADQGDGTVGIFQLGGSCATAPVCPIGTTPSESNPPSGGSAPFGIVLLN